MSFVEKAKAKVEEVMGDFKESVGEAYGNEALEVDGEVEADAAREREAALEADERGPGVGEPQADPEGPPAVSDVDEATQPR